MSATRLRSPNSTRSARGLTTAPERRWEPTCLPFSSTATGTSPSRPATCGSSSSSWPRRIAHASPAGPAPTIRTPTSIRSPTTPRSANSKIGAFPSLLIATTTPELCIPTLCWIAPEMPTAMYSFGETVLPVCPTWAAYGYQPASTTARVAATAPSRARRASSSRARRRDAPEKRERSQKPLLREKVDDLLRAAAVVLDFHRVAARRRLAECEHLGLRAGFAELRSVDAEVRRADALLRLLLRAHDPLQRRIARLVDRVRHGDHRGQRRLDRVVAELRLPLHARLAVRDRQLRGLRHERHAQAVRNGGPEDGAVGVARLLAEQDHVGCLAFERLRKRETRRHEVRARGGGVADEHGAVGAHREPLAQRVESALGPQRHEHDLALAARLFHAQRLLDRVRVERVQRPLTGAVEPLGRGIEALCLRLGHLLHAYGDLHRAGL